MNKIASYINKTPIITNDGLNREFGADLYFKCENLQKTGSFKYRGACNAILNLTNEQRERGVITVSSGNHGAALARAGSEFNVKTHIIVPENSSAAKIANIKKYGAEISYCSTNVADRIPAVKAKQKNYNYHFISPYNDINVINGQATIAEEIFSELKNLDIIMAPIGGGGLISGTILARDKYSKNTEVYAAEPEGANDAYLSFTSKKLIKLEKTNTICDGLRGQLGDLTYPIIQKGLKSVITIDDKLVLKAMKTLWENLKLIIEPSSATVLATLLKHPNLFKNKKTCLILTGGNTTLNNLPW